VEIGFHVRARERRELSLARVSTRFYHRETHPVGLSPVRVYSKSNQREGFVVSEASQDAFLPSPSSSPDSNPLVSGRLPGEGVGREQACKQSSAVWTLSPRSACVTVFVPSRPVVVVVHLQADPETVKSKHEACNAGNADGYLCHEERSYRPPVGGHYQSTRPS